MDINEQHAANRTRLVIRVISALRADLEHFPGLNAGMPDVDPSRLPVNETGSRWAWLHNTFTATPARFWEIVGVSHKRHYPDQDLRSAQFGGETERLIGEALENEARIAWRQADPFEGLLS